MAVRICHVAHLKSCRALSLLMTSMVAWERSGPGRTKIIKKHEDDVLIRKGVESWTIDSIQNIELHLRERDSLYVLGRYAVARR